MAKRTMAALLGLAIAACAEAPPDSIPRASTSAELYPVLQPYQDELVLYDLVDEDRVGGPRPIPLAIRRPLGLKGPLPVVIWSHGGAHGSTSPQNSMEEWSRFAAREGYVSVSIAHVPRSDEQRAELCSELAIPDCELFKYLNWDRPRDIELVLDALESPEPGSPFAKGRIDLQRIALGGHSAGAGATMMVAGAMRTYGGVPTWMEDPRPRAFLTFSPQGPGSEGFVESSWDGVLRPNLLATGLGDENDGNTPESRALPHDLMPPGDKFRVFLADLGAVHGVFDHKPEACAHDYPLDHCKQLVGWLESATLAFLDAYLRDDANAQRWLASDNLPKASVGVAQWSHR
ncbi:MAG: hypothetical protein KC776_36710 [Myxococcales bacterium]|nr:hypothetical protein [Myxococcales bacterium]MCB9582649.1 hypothetical protein [Polyangiaceae bacterium]